MVQRSVDIPQNVSCRISLKPDRIVQVALWDNGGSSHPCRIWKLIPVKEENLPTGSDSKKNDAPPTYFAE